MFTRNNKLFPWSSHVRVHTLPGRGVEGAEQQTIKRAGKQTED